MTVTLKLGTVLTNQTNYLSGFKAQLLVRQTVFPATGLFSVVETQVISNPGHDITVNFAQNVNGPFRMVIRDGDNKLRWRSVELQPHADGSPFRYSLVAIEEDRTTLTGSDMTATLDLPMVEDIDGLDEDLVIEKVTVVVHDDHITVMPKGKVAKGDDWTILKSDFDINYKMSLSRSTSVIPTQMVKVTSRDLQMNFSNPVTGIGANCVRDSIRDQVSTSIRRSINDAIEDQLRNQVAGQFGDNNPLNNEVSATVLSVDAIQTGTENISVGGINQSFPVFSLRLVVEASIPSQLIRAQTGARSGCFGMVLFLAACASGTALLLVFAL